jgi:hypothetical protein
MEHQKINMFKIYLGIIIYNVYKIAINVKINLIIVLHAMMDFSFIKIHVFKKIRQFKK